MSTESIIPKTGQPTGTTNNQSYGSVLAKEGGSPRPMPRLSALRNRQNHVDMNSGREEKSQIDGTPTTFVNNNNNNLIKTNENNPVVTQQYPTKTNADQSKTTTADNQQQIRQKGESDIESSAGPVYVDRPYPKYVFFIIGNEFCERFSFYGLRAILVLYFRNVLGFSETSSTVSFHLFMTLCYFTPIIGAILGDSIWGKYNTILYLSVVYFIGEMFLVLSSILWNNQLFSVGLTILSLILIGGGTGGIKPCVSALSGDQFLPNEQQRIQYFFSMFYFSINAGSLISTFLTPVLRSDINCVGRQDCFPLAFGVPCVLMFVGLLFFMAAKSRYTINPLPKDNVLVSFVRCIYYASSVKLSRKKPRTDTTGATSDTSTLSVDTLPISSQNSLIEGHDLPKKESKKNDHWIYLAQDRYDRKTLDEFRSVLGLLVLFLPLPVFWCLFDQQSSRWTLQATRMDGHVFGMNLKPDQIQVANPLLLLGMIPLFDMFIYPMFNKCGFIKTPLQRMTAGGLLAGLTFFTSALIEQRIEQYKPSTFVPVGQGHMTIINGMSNCHMVYPKFFVENDGGGDSLQSQQLAKHQLNNIDHIISAPIHNDATSTQQEQEQSHFNISPENRLQLNNLSPFESKSIGLVSDNIRYNMTFNLHSSSSTDNTLQMNVTSGQGSGHNCPMDADIQYQVSLPSIKGGQSMLLYIYQANGEVKQKAFQDDINIPNASSARVKIIMDILGSGRQGMDSITIKPTGDTTNHSMGEKSFVYQSIEGNILSTEYLDVDAQNSDDFALKFPTSKNQLGHRVKLQPGSRSLIVAHEYEPKTFTIKQEQLQDNKYMISVLWQLIPYIGISAGEVMFSVTGLDFSYSAAPKSMKSIIFGAWYLTTAFGNLLTVAIESMHIFDDIATEFYFYGILMILDMIIFALIAYNFNGSISSSSKDNVSDNVHPNNDKDKSKPRSDSSISSKAKAKPPLPADITPLNINYLKDSQYHPSAGKVNHHDTNNNARVVNAENETSLSEPLNTTSNKMDPTQPSTTMDAPHESKGQSDKSPDQFPLKEESKFDAVEP